MREIKFRAFYEGEMVPVWFMTCWLPTQSNRNNFKQKWFAGFDDRRELLNDDVPIMQSTGLSDKNVWESDIILFEPKDHSTDMPQKAVVEYCEKRACFIAHSSAWLIPLHNCRILEVIGNVHENKDLLP